MLRGKLQYETSWKCSQWNEETVLNFSLLLIKCTYSPTLSVPSPVEKISKDYGLFPGRSGKCDSFFDKYQKQLLF